MFEDLKLVAGNRLFIEIVPVGAIKKLKKCPVMLQPIFQKGEVFYAQEKKRGKFVFIDVTQAVHELKAMHKEFFVEIKGKTLAEYNLDPKKEILAYENSRREIIIDNIEPFVEKMSKIQLSVKNGSILDAAKARIASGIER